MTQSPAGTNADHDTDIAIRQHQFVTSDIDPLGGLITHIETTGLLYRVRRGRTWVIDVFYPHNCLRYRYTAGHQGLLESVLLGVAREHRLTHVSSRTIVFPDQIKLQLYVEDTLGTPAAAVVMMPQTQLFTAPTSARVGEPFTTADEIAYDLACEVLLKTRAEVGLPSQLDDEPVFALADLTPMAGWPTTPTFARLTQSVWHPLAKAIRNAVNPREHRRAARAAACTRASYAVGNARLDFTQELHLDVALLIKNAVMWRHHADESYSEPLDLALYDRTRSLFLDMSNVEPAWEHDPQHRDAYRQMRQHYCATRTQEAESTTEPSL